MSKDPDFTNNFNIKRTIKNIIIKTERIDINKVIAKFLTSCLPKKYKTMEASNKVIFVSKIAEVDFLQPSSYADFTLRPLYNSSLILSNTIQQASIAKPIPTTNAAIVPILNSMDNKLNTNKIATE